jgi:signal transduction histidine kinase
MTGHGLPRFNTVQHAMHRTVLSVIVLASLLGPAAALPVCAQPRQAPAAVLTRISEIRALTAEDGARGYRVRIRGIVTHFDENGHTLFFLHDGEWGQYVDAPAEGNAEARAVWDKVRRGDVVEIEGHTVRGGFAPNVVPERIRQVGRSPLPAAKRVPYALLLTGRHDCDYVEIEGVVQRVWVANDPINRGMFAEIALDDGLVRATLWGFTQEDLRRFVDARIRLRGNAGTLFGQLGQLRGVSIFGGTPRDIEVLAPPPDPFSIPLRSIRSIYNYSSAGEVNRRIRVRGVVTSQVVGRPVQVTDFTASTTFRDVRHVVYLRDAESGARIETEQELLLRPGQVVEAAGFPAVTPGKPILRNAVLRVVGDQPPVRPVDISPANAVTAEHDAELVRIQGQLLGILRTSATVSLVLKSGDAVFDAGVDASYGSAITDIRPGSNVSVTGVYAYQWGPPASFRLFLRSPDDVSVLSAAPWWTMRHSAVLAAIVALMGFGAIAWVRVLSNQKKQKFQAILSERSRVARELHDTLEQGLAGIALQLEAVAGSLEASPVAARQSLDVARQMLRYSQEEARRSVMDLRSEALESLDLPGALTSLARQMTVGTSPRVDVHVEGAVRRLETAHEHHLLRIGLEALTNALKHADAASIQLVLRFSAEATTLIVSDDGRGVAYSTALTSSDAGAHFGLQGIRERVDKMGGEVVVESEPGAGTRLTVTVPSRADRGAFARPVLKEIWPGS